MFVSVSSTDTCRDAMRAVMVDLRNELMLEDIKAEGGRAGREVFFFFFYFFLHNSLFF